MSIAAAVEHVELGPLAPRLGLKRKQVEAVVGLLDEGNTVPFITRYRKDQTGGLDEVQIRGVEEAVTKARLLAQRKAAILRSIESQGKLTPKLRTAIEAADSIKRLEDLYLPYRPKKQTLATQARQRGLAPFAAEILKADQACEDLAARAAAYVDPELGVNAPEEALQGAGHILAELFSERPDIRGKLRSIFLRTGVLRCVKGDGQSKNPAAYRDFFDYTEPIKNVPPHRVLAINRGERAKALRVKIEAATDAMRQAMEQLLLPPEHRHREFLAGCLADALARLIQPSLEREVRREMTEEAEAHAVEVFARNLRNLLLQSPVHNKRILAIDPGFKSGCKLVALDEFGGFLEHNVVHVTGKTDERREEARAKLLDMVRRHRSDAIVIGNGTACRETETVVADLIAGELADSSVRYAIVNEAGASVYSASDVGRQEFPDLDATVRGAISIGRRLLDPLSELVKIEPANIGVGLYQHDVKGKHLQASLDNVVESAVNFVGVDVNTASVSLLRYVSGLNQLTARRLFEHRNSQGPFKTRSQLKEAPGIGEATFVQAAGFLRISEGEEPLDATWIHPESYDAARRALEKLGFRPEQLRDKQTTAEIAAKVKELDVDALAEELDVGALTLKDILTQLCRPGRDPREDLPSPMFKTGVLKLEDVKPGMELTGSVLNVVDFGAFVDVGLKDSGLVHVSQLGDRFVRDPHDVVSVGDVVKVWVLDVDAQRRRVSLTMVDPAKPAPGKKKRRRKPKKKKKEKDRKPQGEVKATAPAEAAGAAAPSDAPKSEEASSSDSRSSDSRSSVQGAQEGAVAETVTSSEPSAAAEETETGTGPSSDDGRAAAARTQADEQTDSGAADVEAPVEKHPNGAPQPKPDIAEEKRAEEKRAEEARAEQERAASSTHQPS